MMPLPTLYEAVPVNILPPTGRHHVITKDGMQAIFYFTGNEISIITMREQYSHWLRPYTAEELVRKVAEMAFKAGELYEYEKHFGAVPSTEPDLQTFTDNLIRELTGNNSLTTKQ